MMMSCSLSRAIDLLCKRSRPPVSFAVFLVLVDAELAAQEPDALVHVQHRVHAAQGRAGLRLVFEDSGPGIPDINAAMRDGFSTGRGLGKGLPGSKRLVDVFEIESEVGRGTRVTVVRWL